MISTMKIHPNKKSFFKKVAAILLALAVWQTVAMLIDSELILVTPTEVLKRLLTVWREPTFFASLFFTSSKIILGFLTAFAVGIGLGALAGCTSLRELSLPFFGAEPGATASTHLGYLFGAEAHTWNASAVPESLVIVSLLSGDVPDNAFYGCRALARVTLPENCTRIGVRAFLGCTALQEVTLPDGVQSVGELAFARCTTLCRVTWGDSLQSLGMQAFLGCTNLTEITLPDALASLANATFSGCSNLRDLTLGSAMREVGTGAFHGCVSLSSLTRADASLALNVGEDNEPLLRLLSSRP